MIIGTGLGHTIARSATLITLAAGLGGCSMLPASLNPSNWYDSVARVVAPNDPPAYGDKLPYPNLSTVPARPITATPAERQTTIAGLRADRDNATHKTPVPFDAASLGDAVPPAPVMADTPVAPGTPSAALKGTRVAASKGYTATQAPPAPLKSVPLAAPEPLASASQIPVGAPVAPVIPPIPTPAPLAQPAITAAPSAKPAPAPAAPLLEAPPPAPTDLGVPQRTPSAFVIPVPGVTPPDARPAQVVAVVNRPAAEAPAQTPAPTPAQATEPFGPPKPPARVQTASLDVDIERAFVAKPNDANSATRSFTSALAAEIYFAANSCVLTQADRQILKAVAGARAQRSGSLRIIGYAGQGGGAADIKRKLADFQLAVGRAGAVAEALASFGVDQSTMQVTATDVPSLPRDFAASADKRSPAALDAALRRAEIFIEY